MSYSSEQNPRWLDIKNEETFPSRDGVRFLDQLQQPPTESVIAELLATFDRDYRFTPEVGWYRWDPTGWQRDNEGQLLYVIRRLIVYLTNGTSDARKAQTSRFISGVERIARRDPQFHTPTNGWDTDTDWVGTPSGNIHLPTGRWEAPQQQRRITHRLRELPELDGYDCPRWLRFLQEATSGDQELINFIQRFVGYSLTGHTSEHTLCFVYGDGGTGKTAFINVVRDLLGTYARHADMSTFLSTRNDRHPTDLAMLAGSRLVTAVETDERRPWDEAKLKALTGSDPVTARFMRQDFFTYRPQFKLLIAGNHLPTLKSPDQAMRRRFRVIPFTHQPETPDPQLPDKLRYEYADILAWAIEGAQQWYLHGLGTAAIVDSATAAYFTESDLIGQWLEATCDLTHTHSETSQQLWRSWREWARNNGCDAGTQTTLGRALTKRGLDKRHTRNGNRWHGITFRDTLGEQLVNG